MDSSAYKCPSCGAPLVFNPVSADLHCEFCDSHFSVEQIEEKLDEKRAENQTENPPADAEGSAAPLDNAHLSAASPGDAKWADTEHAYVCKNCGAQLVTTSTVVAMTCPYCDNNIVLDDRVDQGRKPDGLIPFAIPREMLGYAVKCFYKKKSLLPRDFYTQNLVEHAVGLYVPFWLYNATVDGHATYKGTKTRTYTTSHERVTETKHYRLHRAGTMRFDKVPVDASKRMDNDLMDSIEGYDFTKFVPFDGGYLSGFYADRYDEDVLTCLLRANRRMEQSVFDELGSTTHGYHATFEDGSTSLRTWSANYVLLPVWVFNCRYKGKTYRYAVNGQNGKVAGELPISFWKGLLWFLGTFALTALVVFGLLMLMKYA